MNNIQALNETYAGNPTVGCVFRNTQYAQGHEKVYTYMIPPGMNPKVGDLGIVENDGVYSIVNIRARHDESRVDPEATYRYKWLVGFVSIKEYQELIMKEDQLLAAIAQTNPSRI